VSVRWQRIRAHAAAVRARYAAEIGVPAPALLPLEDLAERLFLISVFDDPALDMRINGELNPAVGSIRVQVGLPPSRRRFVIAHELGHVVLEDLAGTLYEDDDTTIDERAGGEIDGEAGVLRAYNTRERHEQEANLFALELLLPAADLWQALQRPGWTIAALAQTFGVSSDAVRTQLVNVCCLEPVLPATAVAAAASSVAPDPQQQQAVDAPLPLLVVAGPGTGKTRTIVAKYLSLVAQAIDPAHILALTFSNKAAEELRERIIAALGSEQAGLASRIEVTTFHAWGLNFLRQYGHQLGLSLDLQLRSTGDLYVLLRHQLEALPLDQYKDLREPGMYLAQIIGAISRAKDELCDPSTFARLAAAEAERVLADAERRYAGKMTKTAQQARDKAARDAARLRELAAIYASYTALLDAEGVLDYGDLIMRAVEALRLPVIAAAAHAQYHYILIDEFQDINYASGELVRLLDGGRGRVWAVGDPWQSIYRFRGAAPANLQQFNLVYPTATTRDLRLNYRSAQAILDAGHALMAPDPLAATRGGLVAWRDAAKSDRAVVEWVVDDADAEGAAIAHDILRRVRRARRSSPCARRRLGAARRVRSARPHIRHRRWRFADHAVLCRTHAQAARIIAALQAHGIPVDQVGDLFDTPEIKDVLAIIGMAQAPSSIAMLRALTIPAYALDAADLATLVELAQRAHQPLLHAARDPAIIAQLGAAGRRSLHELLALADDLAAQSDAWQILTRYLFEHSAAVRARIAAAAHGDFAARRALAALGQLILLARNLVRRAPITGGPTDFVAYVRQLIEAGEKVTAIMPAEHADMVQVMTVHAAKGLEFPIVYVPGLQEGVFPPRKQHGSIPALPGLSHSAGDELQEERYLLYVAMTRARERLVLSRALRRREKPARRSPLLPGGPDGVSAPWPIIRRAAGRACPPPPSASRLLTAPLLRTPIPAAGLETYARCPRQYFYQYGYQLYDDRSPYQQMHQAIRAVAQELAQRTQQGTSPPDEAALHALTQQFFAEPSLAEATYRDDYFAEAMRHVTQIWRDMSAAVAAYNRDHRYILRRPAGDVAVRIDRVEAGDAGPRWVRDRSGRARDGDHLSIPIMLYALTYLQEHGALGEIAIHYSATGDRRPATPTPDVLADHAAAIDRLLTSIQAGDWSPSVGQQCATCPFNLICPV
jgi:DNA helicase-2/ATP-dependent DNA helicase PcrA